MIHIYIIYKYKCVCVYVNTDVYACDMIYPNCDNGVLEQMAEIKPCVMSHDNENKYDNLNRFKPSRIKITADNNNNK